jgi:hypothetical protein
MHPSPLCQFITLRRARRTLIEDPVRRVLLARDLAHASIAANDVVMDVQLSVPPLTHARTVPQ